MTTDSGQQGELGRLRAKLLGLTEKRYRPVPVPRGDGPVRVIAAIPLGDDDDPAGRLPRPARPDMGRAPSGSGLNEVDALLRCLGEAAEFLSVCRWGDETLHHATAAELGDGVILPNDLLLISERQYGERDRWNARHGAYAWLPAPFDSSRPVDWLEARSPDGGAPRWVPAAYALIGYSNAGDPDSVCVADNNGCAAAGSLEEAVVRGFLELVERDATAIWWYGECRRPQVDLSAVSGHGDLFDWLENRRRRSRVLDIGSDLGIPVYAAVSHEPDGSVVALGCAADFDAERAALSAVLEMCQMETSFEALGRHGSVGAHPDVAAWLAGADLATCVCCQALPGKTVDLAIEPTGGIADPSAALERCLEICAAHGLSLSYIDLTRESVGVPVARTIVPGLRQCKPRFGPGRLYDVPLSLGWRQAPLEEARLAQLQPLIV